MLERAWRAVPARQPGVPVPALALNLQKHSKNIHSNFKYIEITSKFYLIKNIKQYQQNRSQQRAKKNKKTQASFQN
jgi:hypothetical protein